MEPTFELPPTKRVRRSDLHSSSSRQTTPDASSPPPQPLPLEIIYDISTFDAPSPPKQPQEESYEFRLFRSAPSVATASDTTARVPTTHKISVRSPTPPSELGEGGFLGPGRPLGYYLTAHVASDVRKKRGERFRVVAVEGGDVRGKGVGSCAWRGCELPWRVMHIRDVKSKAKKTTAGATVLTTEGPTGRRKRAGKKRRIAMRMKVKAEGAKEEAAKEKKARRNSRKKARKREKEKEKKAGRTPD